MLEFALPILLAIIFFTVPGYFLSLGIFPKKGLPRIERAAYSLFFSMAFLSILAMLEYIAFNAQVTQLLVAGNMALLSITGLLIYFLRSKKIRKAELQPVNFFGKS